MCRLLVVVAGLAAILLGSCSLAPPDPEPAPPLESAESERGQAADQNLQAEATDAATLARVVAAIWDGGALPEILPNVLARKEAAVYVALRRQGLRLSQAWAKKDGALGSLRAALARARKNLGAGAAPDTIELVVAHSFRSVPYTQRDRVFSNPQRGISGIELSHGESVAYVGPTQVIATNRPFRKIIDRFAASRNLAQSDLAGILALRRFAAEQFLVALGPEATAVRLFRGNRLIRIDEVTQASVRGLAGRMTAWLIRNLHPSGRMTYRYWPSNGRESSTNNMIRQWMATLALIRSAAFSDDRTVADLAERNIGYNLELSYRRTGELGAIEFQGKAKLGAMAVAALALAEHPNGPAFEEIETALRRTIEHLWAEDGSFKTFLKPEGRNDNQNFYPGEALLYLATVQAKRGSAALLERLMLSVRYYRAWHRAGRDPAFVPWHTMAAALIWRQTADPFLRDWVFEMNDWLLGIQQASAAYPDIDGRFYDPERPHFGPPHASSTGVYLESLIQAFRIAREVGDSARAEAYRRAILRGLRSLMQLEFRDGIDMFYVSKRGRTRGGLRTTVYNNEIRVDNVQHGLMALFEILNAFEADDYVW